MKNDFIFFGTPDVAVVTLDALFTAGYIPKLIVTAPDRPSGRGMKLTPPPVKLWADEHSIPTIQPEKITDEVMETLKSYCADLFVVIAYGKILPEALIQMPRLGTINTHYSLLPRWRGASPVEAAILAGDAETGVAIQQMVYQLDAGDIIAEAKTPIGDNETAPELRARLAIMGGKLIVETMPKIFSGDIHPTKQDENGITKCGKFMKSDAEIHPDTDDHTDMWRKYKAYAAWPKVWFIKNEKRYKVTSARFENGKFIIEKVIPEGEKEVSW
jgi:methionyl-tRNA formyltransferase